MSRHKQTQDREVKAIGSMMSRNLLPMIGSSGSKTGAKPPLTTQQRPSQMGRRKCHHPAQTTDLPADTITPWSGLSMFDSSFTSILPPTPPPPVPLSSHICNQPGGITVPSPPVTEPKKGGRAVRVKRRVVPQSRFPRAPRLSPPRPVTNLSFTRSFTFSFFELPLHYSPHSRVEHLRDLMLLFKQIQY